MASKPAVTELYRHARRIFPQLLQSGRLPATLHLTKPVLSWAAVPAFLVAVVWRLLQWCSFFKSR